jgi:uncharacterized protein
MNRLHQVISGNSYLSDALNILKEEQSEQFYIGAGAITQTVWNYLFGNEPAYGIEDLDIVYFNNTDICETAEQYIIDYLTPKLMSIPFSLDVKNQARVHLWYNSKFGYAITPIISVDDALSRWPTTANAVCVRMTMSNNLEIHAPFGLDDLFSGIIRANKKDITREIYYKKANKWLQKWPGLKVIPWE